MVSNNQEIIDFVSTLQFLRLAIQVAMATMNFLKVQTCVSFRNILFLHLAGPNEQFGTPLEIFLRMLERQN